MKILQNPFVSSLLGLVLYAVVTVLVWKAPATIVEGELAQADIVAHARAAAPSWEFQSPEAEMLISELKEQKAALNKREKDLNDLAERLQAERLEINVVTQAVYQLQRQVEASIVRINAEELANLKKLARTYAAMSPEGAAPIFKEMEENTLIKILALMKETETAPVLEEMSKLGADEAKRVANLTERLRFYLSQPKDAKKTSP
jgi:flagellar motility protein MotE (MotC chaperone)